MLLLARFARKTISTLRRPPLVLPNCQHRSLHLAPPFLLDDPYIARYEKLTPSQISSKRNTAIKHLQDCNLCPRLCGVNRFEKTGTCLIPAQTVKVATIGPHFGEEPCIQGHRGSGSVFFSGCNLRCVFCQNHDIAHQRQGQDLTPEELGEWCIKLQEYGAHNINFVTPEHVVPQVVRGVLHAKEMGLRLPVIYNTSSYDSVESLELLDGIVDIYLPDFKVWTTESSRRLLKADDYAKAARESIRMMHQQVGDLCFSGDGIAKRGVLLRHLVMPGKENEGVKIMRWLAETVSRDMYVNIMEQYHPDAHVGKPGNSDRRTKATEDDGEPTGATPRRYQEINRSVSDGEISIVRRAAEDAGIWRFCDPPRHDGFSL